MGATRAGRKRVFPHQKMLEALHYCIAYCDDQDGCEDCMFKGVRIDNATECPIYVMSALYDVVKEKAKEHDERYNKKRYNFAKD